MSAPTDATRPRYAFGPFVADLANRRLERGAEAVPITARVFDILAVLLQDAGRMVEKETLLDKVWGDVSVEEGNLTRNVSTLRKVLGESSDDPRYIVTLPGRGYQFVAPVRVFDGPVAFDPVATPASNVEPLRRPRTVGRSMRLVDINAVPVMPEPASLPPEPASLPTPLDGVRGALSNSRRAEPASLPLKPAAEPVMAPRVAWLTRIVPIGVAAVAVIAGVVWMIRGATPQSASAEAPSRIVVLPFKNLAAADEDYFAAGITEEITSRLTSFSDLRVISATTASHYEHAGKTVADIAAGLNVDYVLEGSVRWAMSPEKGETLRITAQLIRAADDTHVWTESFDRTPGDLFEVQSEIATRVVRELRGTIQPVSQSDMDRPPTRNPEAHRAYLRGQFYARRPDNSEENQTTAIMSLQRAVDLDPDFAQAQALLARAHRRFFTDGYDISIARQQMSLRAVERAEALAPGSPDTLMARGAYALNIGRDRDKALAAFRAAERLRPNDATVILAYGSAQLNAGLWTDAAATLERALALDPRNAEIQAKLAMQYIGLRRYADAQAAADRSLAEEPDQLLAFIFKIFNTWLWRGDLTAARALLDRLPPDPDWRFVELRVMQALYERRYQDAVAVTQPFGGRWMRGWVEVRPVVLWEAQARRLLGDQPGARTAFETARRMLEEERRAAPSDGRVRTSLAIALAGLGRKDEARQEARRALALMPYPDAFDGTVVRQDVALAYTMIGDYEAALTEIATLLRKSGALLRPAPSSGSTVGPSARRTRVPDARPQRRHPALRCRRQLTRMPHVKP